MNNSFWIPLLVSFGTMIFLYLLGFVANIEILLFKLSLSHTEISLLPIVVGMVMGFISERIIKWRARAN
ncbi:MULTISPECIES: ATPase [unclassified Sporosarcina]|uniref:ATPase n=1 Tax=unclassified Sporosarcina TaxID=2647733 RepID=UPI000C16B9BF|nr:MULTISPECIES: ATPase [unclassified Sporosarcina]PID01353.1 ATPase [Sporosarcina sp. P2]PID25075.1 ATPase [Sporosarcina sp. P7]